MALLDAFLEDAAPFNFWIAARSDGLSGSGTASDPFNGSTKVHPARQISLVLVDPAGREARATFSSPNNDFSDGDVVIVSGVTGMQAEPWNGTFGIYNVSSTGFSYLMRRTPLNPQGSPAVNRLSFLFDEVMRHAPERIKICIGPGVFQTRGFAPNDARGWQPKTGQNIVGVGIDVTTLQLVGAENADQHYHVVGMPIETSGTAAIAPLKHFQISDLTIDCNVDGHSGRPDPGYTNVACGAVRILGDHARIRNVKAINWGTKSLKQGCFVLSIIQASAQPSGGDGNPVITETQDNGIEDCICIQPSKNNARETTVLHLGGVKNATNHAQGFGTGAFIRKNFVNCQFTEPFVASGITPSRFSSAFVTSAPGTLILGDTGIFTGKRPHYRIDLDELTYVRFHNPKSPLSRWNGYFRISLVDSTDYAFSVLLGTAPPNTNDDSSLVIMGTEFRAIAVSSCLNAVVEQNQIHNCWIGGPYQGPMDDEAVFDPEVPPTLAREERLDPLNALNTRSLTVRDNYYRNVAVGPYFNMGGVSGQVNAVGFIYGGGTDLWIAQSAKNHLWVNARVRVEPQWNLNESNMAHALASPLVGTHEIIGVDQHTTVISTGHSTFGVAVPAGLPPYPTFLAHRLINGADYLVIENNQIYLADLDETEFALKEYPLAANPAEQRYRAYGIVVADNEISPVAGPYAHRQVIIRNNRIGYPDGQTLPVLPGLGRPVGGGMMLAGIAQLHVTHNVLEVQGAPALRTLRCGMARFFHNNRPNGEIIPGYRWESQSYYDEPESIVEDAFVLSLLTRRKWR